MTYLLFHWYSINSMTKKKKKPHKCQVKETNLVPTLFPFPSTGKSIAELALKLSNSSAA